MAAAGAPPALASIAFDSLAPSDDALLEHLTSMAATLDLPGKLKKTMPELQVYFNGCKDAMTPNPFHNWHHVFDVTQFCFTMLVTTDLHTALADECVVGMFLAAIAHDMDHRGKSNVFEINEKTELATKYKNKSPLESHHCACALELLESTGVLSALDPAKTVLVRAVVQECILATDMGKHGEIMKMCATAFGSADFDPTDYYSAAMDGDTVTGKGLLLLKLIIKGSDISNPCRPYEIASQWNELCYAEFYGEGDVDREKGRALNPLHDRDNNSIPKSSIGFIGFVVQPIFAALHKFLVAAAAAGARVNPDAVKAVVDALNANKAIHQKNAAK